jgi:leader peptidase (prepilin peptidase)/N-methyltransferase
VIGAFPFLLGVALLGACLGSFFNVVVWRVPRGMSIVRPGSHCPSCGTPIPFWRNVPVLTWFFQRGRAACCGTRISARYVLVESFTALLSLGWGAALLKGLWGGDLRAALGWYVLAMLAIPLALIDWEFFVIPDGLSLTAFGAGILLRTFLGGSPVVGFVLALRDAALCAGGLYLFAWILRWALARLGDLSRSLLAHRELRRRWLGGSHNLYRRVTRALWHWTSFDDDTEVLGLGDVNLMAAAGALLGPMAVLAGVPLAAVLGIFGFLVRAALPNSSETARAAGVDAHAVPFAPFLCGGMLLAQPLLPYLSELLRTH